MLPKLFQEPGIDGEFLDHLLILAGANNLDRANQEPGFPARHVLILRSRRPLFNHLQHPPVSIIGGLDPVALNGDALASYLGIPLAMQVGDGGLNLWLLAPAGNRLTGDPDFSRYLIVG